MKFIRLLPVFFFFSGVSMAQVSHFIYIESAGQRPFYARAGQKTYSSSATGYLLLPKLSAGKLPLRIGFPRNESPAQEFLLEIDRDAGFLLKPASDSSWELINLQTFAKVPLANQGGLPEKPPVGSIPDPGPSRDTVSRAVASSDSIQTDSPVPVKQLGIWQQAGAEKNAAYLVRSSEGIDTVDVRIELEPEKAVTMQDTIAASDEKSLQPVSVTDTASVQHEKKVADEAAPLKKEKKPLVRLIGLGKKNKPAAEPTAACTEASREDFLSLRRKMVARKSEEEMTQVAGRYLESSCLSVAQVASLGALYLSDEGRVAFFETCFRHVSDPDKFTSLANQLSDENALKRFHALQP